MKLLICSLALILCSVANAGTFSVHTVTTHVGVEGLETVTPGLSYTTDSGYRFGGLRNSFALPSLYAAKIFPINETLRIGVGVVSGYTWHDGLRGDRHSAIPLLAIEQDITDNISVLWFGQAFNLEVRF